MITFTEHFKYADVTVVALGIVTFYLGQWAGRRLSAVILGTGSIVAAVSVVILRNAREHSDSWREFYAVGAIVMLLTSAVGAAIGCLITKAEKRRSG